MFLDKKQLKDQLTHFSRKELEEIILKLSNRKYNFEFLLLNYLDKEGGAQWLFDEAILNMERIFEKEYKGRSPQHREVKRINACAKLISDFSVEVKEKKFEVDLLLYVLRRQFQFSESLFGARFSSYDYKVGLWLKKVITLLTKKLHPDYLTDYQDEVNEMLHKIHHTSNRINTIKVLPEQI